jgi:hypothetical protein
MYGSCGPPRRLCKPPAMPSRAIRRSKPSTTRGLAGGSVASSHEGALLTHDRDQLVQGVAVGGTVALGPAASPADGQAVAATLTVKVAGMPAVSLTANWTTAGAAQAQVLGTAAKKQPLAGTMPAP